MNKKNFSKDYFLQISKEMISGFSRNRLKLIVLTFPTVSPQKTCQFRLFSLFTYSKANIFDKKKERVAVNFLNLLPFHEEGTTSGPLTPSAPFG